jgi:SSS family solute:Na+ symporter
MNTFLIVFGVIYLGILLFLANLTRKGEKSSAQYLLAGSSLGAILGFFTIAATMFSTFSLLGMPDFFRVHGVGAWIFLMVSHCFMAFGIVWVGHAFRKKARQQVWYGISGFVGQNFESRLAGVVIFAGIFIFLLPYIAIQIRGVAIFLHAAFEGGPPIWAWATGLVVIMLAYSEVGGLRAIMYSDVLQGILLLIAIWIIGSNCLNFFGGVHAMFAEVEKVNAALLSVPGPKSLFDVQFLLGSMVAIFLMPYTQPQITTRLVILKDIKSLHKLAIGLGVFGIFIILPTVFMGMYGAVLYSEDPTSVFLQQTYIQDQHQVIASLVMIGIIAAAISTSDSQLFALGGELRSILTGEDTKMVMYARIGIFLFAVTALIFALMSSDELALLARSSFAGTALLAPMIFTSVFHKKKGSLLSLTILTSAALIIMVISMIGILPHHLGIIRLDLALLTLLAAWSCFLVIRDNFLK